MSFDEATLFLKTTHELGRKLEIVKEVGLGYITLGQPSTTLSGGGKPKD